MKHSLQILNTMVQEIQKAPKLYQPSPFWSNLNLKHLEIVKSEGLNNFKGSINMHYFNWSTWKILAHQLVPIANQLRKGNFAPFYKSKLISGNSDFGIKIKNNFLSSFFYQVYVASFFDYLKSKDDLNILRYIEEPKLGEPVGIYYKQKYISQDLCNSVQEFYSIAKYIDIKDGLTVAEIGAGYGRLAYVFLKSLPQCSYCIIDTPPALYLAQQYLTSLFPKTKTFTFRQFHSYKKIKSEFERAKIKFLLPHQIELLPNNAFNLVINISSLHEMSNLQINNYLKQIQRLCRGYFYTKQWRKSRTKDNHFIKEKDYPIPNKWEVVLQHRHPIQKMFFEALYRLS